jgi:hypothetical protein
MSQAVARTPDNQTTPLAVHPSAMPGYWTPRELAEKLHTSERTLQRWHERRTGPPRIAVGGPAGIRSRVILYKISAVEAWLDSLAVKPCRTRTSRRSRRAA